MMSRIAVTGGAGFIGSHLVDALIADGHDVLVIDNLSTGRMEHVHPKADFIQRDILDPGLSDLFSHFRPDAVYHHAAQVSVARSIDNPFHDAKTNILGALTVLDACRMAGVRKCIYASSAAIYGIPETSRLSEKHRIKPQSFYGISKHTPELYLETYRQLYGLDYSVLRYANVFGGRQDAQGEGGVVSIFATQLLSDKRPVIYGTGEQTRDFIYVRDIVAANLAALERGGGLIMNVSSNTSVSIKDLLREMSSLCEQPFHPRYKASRPGDIQDSILDNQVALKELNWTPTYSLRDGLKETLQYYQTAIYGYQGIG
jgi:UDP-glucose 4-epimerase